jgi:hypothetical protein
MGPHPDLVLGDSDVGRHVDQVAEDLAGLVLALAGGHRFAEKAPAFR